MTSTAPVTSGPTTFMNTDFEWSNKMSLIHEDLARAHTSARLAEARVLRRGYSLVMARRLSVKAERAAAQARLAVARVL